MIAIPYDRYMNLVNFQKNEITNRYIESKTTVESDQNDIDNVNMQNERTIPYIKSKTPVDSDKNVIDKIANIENKSIIEIKDNSYENKINLHQDDILSESDITDFIPKSYQRRCKLILNHMNRNNMKWDSMGRLIVGDDCILNTHIVDLIRNGISKYKRDRLSQSSQDFIKLLLATHCPESILNQSVCQNGKNIKKRTKNYKKGF